MVRWRSESCAGLERTPGAPLGQIGDRPGPARVLAGDGSQCRENFARTSEQVL